MKSKVTTKQGDDGRTRTLGGERVPKSSPIIECTGRLDALRARTALLRLRILDAEYHDPDGHAAFLWWLLHVYFLMGTQISDPEDRHPEYRHDTLGPRHLARLEAEMQRVEAHLELPRSFLVSASTLPAAEADVTATVARDFERALVRLEEAVPVFQSETMLVFANRVSDYFFLVARDLEKHRHLPVDYDTLEDPG
jgi:cob(I)alamin adenosyltransferase